MSINVFIDILIHNNYVDIYNNNINIYNCKMTDGSVNILKMRNINTLNIYLNGIDKDNISLKILEHNEVITKKPVNDLKAFISNSNGTNGDYLLLISKIIIKLK